jgi:predicted acyltransferase
MKILAILVVGLCYSYLTSIPAAYALLSSFPNGGLLGSISLSSIVLIGYMSGEYFMKRKKNALPSFAKLGILLTLAGFLLSRFIEYDRNVGTLPYVLLSSGFCVLFLVLVYWVVELKGISSGILEDFGKSALLVFVLNYPVLILAILLGFEKSFRTEQSALVTVVLILFLIVASKLRKRFKKD